MRWVLAAVAAAVPLAPIVAGAVITSSTVHAQTASGLSFTPSLLNKLKPPPRSASPGVPAGPGVLVALVTHGGSLRTAPRGKTLTKLPIRTEFGSPEALWVV